MCGHLMSAGYKATVFNRTASKCAALAERGAQLASTPREVAEASDIVFTIVGYPSGATRALRAHPRGPNTPPVNLPRGTQTFARWSWASRACFAAFALAGCLWT